MVRGGPFPVDLNAFEATQRFAKSAAQFVTDTPAVQAALFACGFVLGRGNNLWRNFGCGICDAAAVGRSVSRGCRNGCGQRCGCRGQDDGQGCGRGGREANSKCVDKGVASKRKRSDRDGLCRQNALPNGRRQRCGWPSS